MSSTMQAINKINNGTSAIERRASSNFEYYNSYSFQPVHKTLPSEESKHELKAREVKKTTGCTRKS
ncbi:unnamed protein product [Brassica rapa subsp. trilocularis]